MYGEGGLRYLIGSLWGVSVCVCVCVCVQAISKLGVPSQNLILLPKSGPSNGGCGRGTALPRHTDACLRGMRAGIHGPGQRGSPPTR